MFSLLDNDAPTLIDKEIFEILFTAFNKRDADELKEYLDKSDALYVFRILEEIIKELTSVKLENLVLIDFLQKNEPYLLIGLDQVRQNTTESRRSMVYKRKSRVENNSSPSLGRTESITSITESSVGSMRRVTTDYRINYRTKAEIAEKLASDLQKSCETLQSKGTSRIKELSGQIEELRYRYADIQETIKSFELHFIATNTLENITQKQMEAQLKKFMNNWLKNGRAILGTMRLKITSIQEQCHHQRTTLISKADLSGMLGPVDFEQLKIKRDDQTKSLEEKNLSLIGLKEVTGKAALSLAKEKKVLIAHEQKSMELKRKTIGIAKGISKIEEEAKIVENEIEMSEQSLKKLKIQVDEFEAPSVEDYIRVKQELTFLEKEYKLLQRKSYIQNIKLKNVTMKLKLKQKGILQ